MMRGVWLVVFWQAFTYEVGSCVVIRRSIGIASLLVQPGLAVPAAQRGVEVLDGESPTMKGLEGPVDTTVDTTGYNVVETRGHHLWFHPTHLTLDNGMEQKQWQSRKHRKGKLPRAEGESRPKSHSILSLKPWDVSWWTAFLFTFGSVVWVINGAFAYHAPYGSSSDTTYIILSATAFVGATYFFFGGWTMYWEALNVDRTAEFDTEVRREARNILLAIAGGLGHHKYKHISSKWRWIGWDSIYSISFMANFLQFVGTTIFWIGPIAWLPGALPEDESEARTCYIIFYWVPQVVGASFLTLSSLLLTLETQHHWWLPRPLSLGWNIGFWNVLGSLGFLLSGLGGIVYGPDNEVGRQWLSNFTTYIGSWFFLFGSALQYYEAAK